MILVSQSPRRKEILEMAGYTFSIYHPNIDEENYNNQLEIRQIPVYLAVQKAKAAQLVFPDEVLVAADTIVVLNNEIIGKPSNASEAFDMLSRLSGNTHTVITGVCILKDHNSIEFNDFSKVTFKQLTEKEINYYIQKHSPYDKAGSYGCQDFIGLIGIESIEGSFYNVMGLPVHKVYSALARVGVMVR